MCRIAASCQKNSSLQQIHFKKIGSDSFIETIIQKLHFKSKTENANSINNKHFPRHNGPRILSPKLELSLKADTNANSNLVL